MNNYTKIEEKYIDEISSKGTIYSHNKTGARICVLENEDTNKVFSIAFRTPPINDCGLTHILEHSVLCGSKAFPIKDPFVELLKGSLNTFLNAFTFPDKTMYPCASQNDKDFKNLMHIYMDAVLYPQIYQHKEIFEQEGWHYHLENKEDPITINGVVYNEMKGAFSDPQQMLFSKIMEVLFPDTAYSYESGGDPTYIPELSYEEFKMFHSKFYHPSNSYICIYGDCDMEERLEWLDKEYLSHFDRIEFDTTIQFQKPFEKPIFVEDYYPIEKGEDKKDKTFLSYNVVLPTTLDNKLMIAMGLVFNTLFNVPGAPIKQALIDANIGQDISSYFEDDIMQPMLGIIASNANAIDEDRFISIIDEEFKKILENGLDKEALLALINYTEFLAREKGFSSRTPQGLTYEMSILSGWLYDDAKAFEKLAVIPYYRELKEELNTTYFEDIIRTYFVNNTHKAYVKLVPNEDCNDIKEQALALKLKEYKESLTDSELDELIAETKHLADYQNEEDSEEALATLPRLEITDISEEPMKVNLEIVDNVLFSEYPTNDIVYANMYFDVTGISKEEMLITNLYTDLFKQIATKNRTLKDLNQYIKNNFGAVSAAIGIDKKWHTGNVLVHLGFAISMLTENTTKAIDFLKELIYETNFNDEKRLLEYMTEIKTNMDMGMVQRGHSVVLKRAFSYIDEQSYYQELCGGLEYLDFLTDIINNFDSKKGYLIEKLYGISKNLIAKDNYTLGITGTKEQLNTVKPLFDAFYNELPKEATYTKEVFTPNVKNEAFTAPINVNFVSRVGKYKEDYTGAAVVLQKAMSMDYLWMKVRVNGGAYGCMMTVQPNLIGFTSYRDPNIEKTNAVYQDAYKFVLDFNPSDEDLLKYKIGAIGGSDTVMHVREKGSFARSLYFRGLDEETRRKNRHALIHCTKEDINKLADIFKEAMEDYQICVIGSTQKINEVANMFSEIKPLSK